MKKKKQTIKPMLKSWFDELSELTDKLSADTIKCFGECSKEGDEQFWRRMFIRALFAQIEGEIYCMKRVALDFHTEDGAIAAWFCAEVALLSDESYELNKELKAITKKKFIPLERNMPFALREF